MWIEKQFNLIMIAGLALIAGLTTVGALKTRKEIKQGKVEWVLTKSNKDTANVK
jgi:hypothetical protein